MQQKQRKKRTALLTGLLTLCTLWMGWGQTEILNEGLRDGNLPLNWSQTDVTFSTAAGGYANLAGTTAVLSTPVIDLSAYNNVEIEFDVAKFGSGSDGPITVEVSTDGGVSWTAQTFDSPTPTGSTYLTSGPTLITTTSATTQIRFTTENSPSAKRLRDVVLTGQVLGSSPLLTTTPTTLTNFDYITGSGPSASQSFEVSGMNLDPLAGNINVAAPANFEVSLDDNTFADDVDIAYTAGEFTDETVYVRLKSGLAENTYNGDITISGGDAADVTVALSGAVVAPSYTTLPYNETFDTDLGDTYVYNVAGTTTWEHSSGTANANGFNGQDPEEQWLVLPGVDFSAYNDALMTFTTTAQYGTIDANNYLKLFYSTDYAGLGDPTTATWTELTFDLPGSVSSSPVSTPSGVVDLAAINGSEVFIAFQYYSSDSPTSWSVDDITIQEAVPTLTANPTGLSGLNYMDGNGPSAAQQFELSGVSLDNSNVTLTAPADFEISEDDITYSNSITLTAYDGTPTDIYVRLQSGLAEDTYSGDITISGGGIAGNITVTLSGEVTPLFIGTIETFDNSNATANYTDNSFVGNGGITWTYVHSRDANNDANGSGINLPALMLRRVADDSKITSEPISGGIGDFSVKLYKGFTGSGNRQVELFINGVSQGTSTPFDDYNEHIFAVNGINISGNVVIEIRNITSSQIIIDDIAWTSYSASTPLLSVTPATLSDFEYIEGSGPSASQSFKVSGMNLDPLAGNINVAASANFEVSLDDNTFADDVDIAYTAGEFTDETVYVRLKSGLAENTYNGDITISGGDAADVTVAVDGEVTPIPQPELLTDPTSITGLNYMDGNGPSAAQQFELSGVSLDNSNVTLTAPADFEISEDDNTYSNSITLSAYDGTPTDIYVRLQSGLAENTYSGDITISGGGITGNITVALSGEVTPFIDQYAGVGVFELVTSLAELEDGYYVVANEASAFLMTNENTSGYFEDDGLILDANDNVVNPATDRVWYIEANGAGYTIYNDVTEKYVGWFSGNSATAEDNVTDNTRWTFSYQDDKFTVNNVATPVRQLSYNSGATRFAAYGNDGQQELQFYKYVEVNDPILSVNPATLANLNYTEGNGPSAAQTFEVSGLNLDTTDVTASVAVSSDFELSADDVTYGDTVTLTAFDGTATTIYVRLKAGLVADNYTDVVAIAGGGATAISVNLEGDVVEPFELPYFNGLRDQTDWDQAQLDGFTFTNESFQTGAGGYVRLEDLGSNIASPAIDFSNYDIIKVSFDLTTFGGNSGQELTVYVSDNDGISYTALGSFAVPVSYETFTEYIDVSGSVSTTGRIKFEMSDGSNSIRFRDLDMDIYSGFVYSGGTWTPSDPLTNATPTDNILIANGTAVLDADFEINNITVANSATLEVENVLKVNGDIENNGAIVFVSSSVANTAQFDSFTGTITGSGTVTAERFIPARRAFRLLSAPVTTTGSINANWQEGANNTGTSFPADNQDPNPGYGTHITGSTTGANGFDATATGNPSLFYLDVANQNWEPFANTDSTTIQAGVPHRLMVRGGRDINVTSNSATPSDTRLRTTGSLHTGPQTQSYTVTAANDLVLFGNPYQASVDMDNVLTNATNINPNFYYIWDPTLGGIPTPGQPGGRGAYVTVDTNDWSNTEGSAIGRYLQPHQAALVRADAPGLVEINFAETDKAVGNLVTVFSAPENTAAISLKLYEANAYDQNNTVSDALKIKFAAEGNNAIDAYDAIKIGNLDENLATENDGNYLSVESRAWPTEDDIIPLFINQHRHQDYVFVAHTQGLEEVDAYLRDHYLMEELLLDNDTDTTYAFSISQDDPNSMATDRFELYFVDATMGVNDVFEGQVVLYPNPSERTFFLQSTALSGKQITVNISNMLGQKVYEQKAQFEDSGRVEVTPQKLPSGVYLVTLQDTQNNTHTIQWIKK